MVKNMGFAGILLTPPFHVLRHVPYILYACAACELGVMFVACVVDCVVNNNICAVNKHIY